MLEDSELFMKAIFLVWRCDRLAAVANVSMQCNSHQSATSVSLILTASPAPRLLISRACSICQSAPVIAAGLPPVFFCFSPPALCPLISLTGSSFANQHCYLSSCLWLISTRSSSALCKTFVHYFSACLPVIDPACSWPAFQACLPG